MNPLLVKSVKIASTLAMISALSLTSWAYYCRLHHQSLPTPLNLVSSLASVALIAHVIEGIIAGVKAQTDQKHPLRYGVYTFFVGFVGLQELFQQPSSSKNQ